MTPPPPTNDIPTATSPIVVIAGCGFVGGRLAAMLATAGQRVIGLVKSEPDPRDEPDFKRFSCDITNPNALSDLATHPDLASASTIHIVHAASSGRGGANAYQQVYLEGLRNLLSQIPRQGGHLVFCSSTSVYAQIDGEVVTEESLAQPDRDTGETLRKAEELALEAGGAVARLAGLYGPGRWHVLRKLLNGTAAIEGGAPGRFLNQIHRDDAASAIAHLLSERLTGLYNATDSSPVRQAECLAWLADQSNLPMPPEAPADLNRKRGWTDKQVSNSKLVASNWQPCYPSYRVAYEKDPELLPSIKALS